MIVFRPRGIQSEASEQFVGKRYNLFAMTARTAAKRTSAKKKNQTTAAPLCDRPFAPGYGLDQDLKGVLSWSWVAKQMGKCRTFWVSTVHPEKRPHVMPVWGVWTDDAFYFSTGRKSRKGRNLADNPACTITNDDGEEAVIVEGSVEEVKDAVKLENIAAAYTKKYKMDPRSMSEPIFAGASTDRVWVHREDVSEVGDALEILKRKSYEGFFASDVTALPDPSFNAWMESTGDYQTARPVRSANGSARNLPCSPVQVRNAPACRCSNCNWSHCVPHRPAFVFRP